MRHLTIREANNYLCAIDMEIGNWNQITDMPALAQEKNSLISYRAPQNAHELFNFSRRVAGWLPAGGWKLFQIDNSNFFDLAQSSFLDRFFIESGNAFNLNNPENSTFLFEFDFDEDKGVATEFLISNIIYLFLLFEGHGQVVSSGSRLGQLISIQDGFVYFCSREDGVSSAEVMLEVWERAPLTPPQWVVNSIEKSQG